ncbi:MAG: hypothetical protein RL300_1773 [Pseudomonadota bacterium]|jgi:hypothetical protein
MFALIEIIKSSVAGLFKTTHDRDEAFLAQSADRYDLERRMRAIDCDGLSGSRRFGSWHLDALR